MKRLNGYSTGFLSVSKFFFLLYVTYSNVLCWAGYYVPMLSAVLLMLAVGSLCIHKQKICINPVLSMFGFYILFAVWVLFTGYIVAVDKGMVTNFITTFVEYLFVFGLVINYSKADKKIDYSLIVFVIQAVIAGLLVMLRGISVQNRATFAEEVNVNTIGIMASLSIAYILYMFITKKKNIKSIAITLVLILFELMVILHTASKKSILSAALFIIMWILVCYREAFRKINLFSKILMIVLISRVCVFAYQWYQREYAEALEFMMYRMELLGEGESDSTRFKFIIEALKVFVVNPIFGVGINNFRYYNPIQQTYSHCFYTEILACTGLGGAVFFVYPIYKAARKISQRYSDISIHRKLSAQDKYILCMLGVFLFINMTQIAFYEFNLMFFIMIFMSYAECTTRMQNPAQS